MQSEESHPLAVGLLRSYIPYRNAVVLRTPDMMILEESEKLFLMAIRGNPS